MKSQYRHLTLISNQGNDSDMSTNQSVVIQEQNQHAVQSHQGEWSRDQIELLKRTVCKGATDDEFKIFCYAVKRTGLDPFVKQIHAVKRWNAKTKREDMSIQVGIDGYRLIADRTEKYAGSDDPVFDNEQNPTKASVTVWKLVQGQRCPFTATARWAEYYPGDNQGFMWKKMPCGMLGKVAETLALRKAFPAELSGVYTDEEMAQAGTEATQVKPEVRHPSDAQLKRLFAISKEFNVSLDQIKDFVLKEWGKNSSKDLTLDEYNNLCEQIQKGVFTAQQPPAPTEDERSPFDEETLPTESMEPEQQELPKANPGVPWAKYRDPHMVK